MSARLMIYGAYGYTGVLIVQEAIERGLTPILAGRSKEKLLPIAREFGLEARAFDVAEAGDHLTGITVLLNCAGPFSKTAMPLVDACIRRLVHYVDITGEIGVFEDCHARHHEASERGVLICPGAGFDIVPTDCLAAGLKERLPGATDLNLGFSFGTKPSAGTLKTTVEGLSAGGMIRRSHRLVSVRNAYRIRKIPFPAGKKWAATIPWGDVFTSGVSTGVPNGMVYAEMPLPLAIVMRAISPFRRLFGAKWVQSKLIGLIQRFFADGPSSEALANEHTQFWGEAISANGKRVEGRMSAPNVYALTAEAAVAIAVHCLDDFGQAGFATPSMLMGSGFVTTLRGVTQDFATVQ